MNISSCPWCGVGFCADGKPSHGILMMIHFLPTCKDSARRRQYKTKNHFFVFIVEPQPIFAHRAEKNRIVLLCKKPHTHLSSIPYPIATTTTGLARVVATCMDTCAKSKTTKFLTVKSKKCRARVSCQPYRSYCFCFLKARFYTKFRLRK